MDCIAFHVATPPADPGVRGAPKTVSRTRPGGGCAVPETHWLWHGLHRLWHGQETVPLGLTGGLLLLPETCGHKPWHGQETVPQQRGSGNTTRCGTVGRPCHSA